NAARSPAPPFPSGSPHSRSTSSGASSSCDSIACPTRRSSTSWTRRSCPSPPCRGDRKSTRLNSSHVSISYAVFCLKKKKNGQTGVGRSAETERERNTWKKQLDDSLDASTTD